MVAIGLGVEREAQAMSDRLGLHGKSPESQQWLLKARLDGMRGREQEAAMVLMHRIRGLELPPIPIHEPRSKTPPAPSRMAQATYTELRVAKPNPPAALPQEDGATTTVYHSTTELNVDLPPPIPPAPVSRMEQRRVDSPQKSRNVSSSPESFIYASEDELPDWKDALDTIKIHMNGTKILDTELIQKWLDTDSLWKEDPEKSKMLLLRKRKRETGEMTQGFYKKGERDPNDVLSGNFDKIYFHDDLGFEIVRHHDGSYSFPNMLIGSEQGVDCLRVALLNKTGQRGERYSEKLNRFLPNVYKQVLYVKTE